jgi:hypothetical protein
VLATTLHVSLVGSGTYTDDEQIPNGELRVVVTVESQAANLYTSAVLTPGFWCKPYRYQCEQHTSKTGHIDCTSTEEWEKQVAYERPGNETGVDSHVEIERLSLAEACRLKEDDGVAGQRIAVPDLTHPN